MYMSELLDLVLRIRIDLDRWNKFSIGGQRRIGSCTVRIYWRLEMKPTVLCLFAALTAGAQSTIEHLPAATLAAMVIVGVGS
jgi:hypothetical protein